MGNPNGNENRFRFFLECPNVSFNTGFRSEAFEEY